MLFTTPYIYSLSPLKALFLPIHKPLIYKRNYISSFAFINEDSALTIFHQTHSVVHFKPVDAYSRKFKRVDSQKETQLAMFHRKRHLQQ